MWRFDFSPPTSIPITARWLQFRKRHLQALAGLFTQALKLCQEAGLVKLGHVAIDGSKLQANASKQPPRRTMSYGRMGEAEKKLKDEIDALLQRSTREIEDTEASIGMSAQYLNEIEVAERTHISLATLRRWRLENRGPRFYKFGSLVRYDKEELAQFEQS